MKDFSLFLIKLKFKIASQWNCNRKKKLSIPEGSSWSLSTGETNENKLKLARSDFIKQCLESFCTNEKFIWKQTVVEFFNSEMNGSTFETRNEKEKKRQINPCEW